MMAREEPKNTDCIYRDGIRGSIERSPPPRLLWNDNKLCGLGYQRALRGNAIISEKRYSASIQKSIATDCIPLENSATRVGRCEAAVIRRVVAIVSGGAEVMTPVATLTTDNKLTMYKSILKPTWTYGIELWGLAQKSNIDKIQSVQSKTLRITLDALWKRLSNGEEVKETVEKWLSEVERSLFNVDIKKPVHKLMSVKDTPRTNDCRAVIEISDTKNDHRFQIAFLEVRLEQDNSTVVMSEDAKSICRDDKCLFCQIIEADEPDKILYKDDEVVVFADIKPASKHHYLVTSKEHIKDAKELKGDIGRKIGE
ncbi:hypothetical protein AAG570_005835 [Ranatra chinensis]|uniref:Adenosine 5'-monophosphoramidase HINT3 n=1 Tax=Ranatra chinensis TaxID=642074 RepID=A0ABD0Y094_9HEMI